MRKGHHQAFMPLEKLYTYQALVVKMVILLGIGWIILGSCLLEMLITLKNTRM